MLTMSSTGRTFPPGLYTSEIYRRHAILPLSRYTQTTPRCIPVLTKDIDLAEHNVNEDLRA